jgi:putative transposase
VPRARHEFSAVLQIAQPLWRHERVNDDAFEGGLEEENRRLTKMCAEERLKAEIVAGAMLKKW